MEHKNLRKDDKVTIENMDTILLLSEKHMVFEEFLKLFRGYGIIPWFEFNKLQYYSNTILTNLPLLAYPSDSASPFEIIQVCCTLTWAIWDSGSCSGIAK